jgi:predicted permease
LQNFWQDLRFGLRMLAKSPGFTALAVLTLALGIGANTAIFSLIEAVLLRSLPVADPQSLVLLEWNARKPPLVRSNSLYGDCELACTFSQPFFQDVSSRTHSFSSVAAFASMGRLNLSGNGPASLLHSQAVSGEFFPMLGVRPAAGRLLVPSDDSVSAPLVMVLSYAYWQTQFGGSRSAIGRTIRLNNVPVTIVGATDARFDSLSPGTIYNAWLPLSAIPQFAPNPYAKKRATKADDWWLVVIGRLKPGVTRDQAQAEVSSLFSNEMLHGPDPLSKPGDDPTVTLLPAQVGLTGAKSQFSAELYVLMTASGVVLLIACANIAGLLLARAAGRQKEIAVRLALGAGRGRILRQLVTESVTLSLIGGAVGILFAIWGMHAMVLLMTGNADDSFGFAPAINGGALAFSAAVSILTGVLFGLAPALRGMRIDLTPALKDSSVGLFRSVRHTRRWFTIGNALVVAQVALTIVVLVGAGLLVRTLENLKNVDPGFETHLLTFSVDPTLIGYRGPRIDNFYRDLQERLSTIPGVKSVSFSRFPLLSGSLWEITVHMPGMPEDERVEVNIFSVGPNFLPTMHLHLLAGRDFAAADFAVAQAAQKMETDASRAPSAGNTPAKSLTIETPTPVIVNEALVRRYYPATNPLGQQFGQPEGNTTTGASKSFAYTIVGVINDAKYQDLRSRIEPTLYVPYVGANATFELLTAGNPLAATAAVRSIVNQMDSNLPVFDVKTQTQLIDDLIGRERLVARLSSFFGLLSLALARIGVYGLLSYEVSRRTREIGIRMALGAQERKVLRLVVRQGLMLAVVGAVLGVGLALAATRYLASMLFNVPPNDPATIVAVTALLALVALAACYIPARRATRVDPMVALRYE